MEGTLTVKAFLEVDNKDTEIRRFAVDQSVCASFAYLGSKIGQVFPKLSKSYKLYWKDADGDLILFSSDDELTDALGFVNDGVFRVYIHPDESDSNTESSTPCHKGVVCDSCEKEICGRRFKCITCPDYDLCYKCESNGVHPDHDMLRICQPRPSSYFSSIFGQHGGYHGLHHPPPPPHHGPPPPHEMGHYPPPHGPPPPPPHHGPPPHGMPPFWGPGMWPWKRMMKRCWKRWMREQGESGWPQYAPSEASSRDPSEDGSRCGEEPVGKDPRIEKESFQKGEGEKDQAGQGTSRQGASGNRDPNDEYLKNMGESVAAMLDPLGIDVHVDVEHNDQRTHVSGGRGRACRRGRGGRGAGNAAFNWSNFPGPWGGAWAGTWGRGGRGGAWSWAGGHRGGAHGFGRQQSNEDDVEMMTTETEPPASTGASSATPAATGRPSQDVNMDNSATQNETTEAGEWTMLGKEKESSSRMDTNRPEDSDAPRVVVKKATAPPASRIEEALDQMKAMGYTDDGGWLTSLLEAKSGDINKVLDSLQPKHQ